MTRARACAPRRQVASAMGPLVTRSLLAASLLWLSGCGNDLGECDPQAADELVYGRNGLVATKGQALAHDSCGNGVFCHSSAAKGEARYGAPAGMNFDMLPGPRGLGDMLSHIDEVWSLVQSGDMPPRGETAVVLADGDWSVDVLRRFEAPILPAIGSAQAKGMFRNWLACGAPVVTETQVPLWAVPPVDPFAGDETPTWHDIYSVIMQPQCALSGCHSVTSASGGLAMADECATYDALFRSGACGEPAVRAGDAAASLLVDKLTATDPRCGDPMPPIGQLPVSFTTAIREWIDAGAEADSCP